MHDKHSMYVDIIIILSRVLGFDIVRFIEI